MTENPTKNTMLADESLFNEQITKNFQQLDLNVFDTDLMHTNIDCERCSTFINKHIMLELDSKISSMAAFAGVLGLSKIEKATNHLTHLQNAKIATITDPQGNEWVNGAPKVINIDYSKYNTTMSAEDLIYEWYEIVSPYYPKIAEHLELDNTYDIDVHYPDKVKYELNGCSTWNQIAQDNPAMLFTEFYLETIRKLSNLENQEFPEPMIEMLDGSFISVEEAHERVKNIKWW